MALLVTNNGEIESLRNLLNANQSIPRNLILKLYTTDTYPAESDTPSQTRYFEPYNGTSPLVSDMVLHLPLVTTKLPITELIKTIVSSMVSF